GGTVCVVPCRGRPPELGPDHRSGPLSFLPSAPSRLRLSPCNARAADEHLSAYRATSVVPRAGSAAIALIARTSASAQTSGFSDSTIGGDDRGRTADPTSTRAVRRARRATPEPLPPGRAPRLGPALRCSARRAMQLGVEVLRPSPPRPALSGIGPEVGRGFL